jgi:hypothetical protein
LRLTHAATAGGLVYFFVSKADPKVAYIFREHKQEEEIDGLLTSSYSKILDSGLALAMSSEVGFLGRWKTYYKRRWMQFI